MSKVSCMCPNCGTVVFIVICEKGDCFKVVCPKCFVPFEVEKKSGLPKGERYELDPRHII
jgi:hypothetical protein